MATFYRRVGKRGVRWTARVRLEGRHATKTFASKGAAETWARAQENTIERGEFVKAATGVVLLDLIDALIKYRKATHRPLGKTASHVLQRLRDRHGLEPVAALTQAFWRRHALARMADGVKSQTAVGDLSYAAVVMRHAAREGIGADAGAPARARDQLREEGLRVASRMRDRRITDDELAALFKWIDDNAARTRVPLRDLVEFALATAMRRGEILAITHEDIQGRTILVRNRKHPRDHDRVDKVPLIPAHPQWPRADPLEVIARQPTTTGRIFPCLGDTVGFWFELAVAGAGLDGVVFHLLRHESLSRYAERGLDVLRLQLIGGHRDLRHLQRYAKMSPEGLAAEMAGGNATA